MICFYCAVLFTYWKQFGLTYYLACVYRRSKACLSSAVSFCLFTWFKQLPRRRLVRRPENCSTLPVCFLSVTPLGKSNVLFHVKRSCQTCWRHSNDLLRNVERLSLNSLSCGKLVQLAVGLRYFCWECDANFIQIKNEQNEKSLYYSAKMALCKGRKFSKNRKKNSR